MFHQIDKEIREIFIIFTTDSLLRSDLAKGFDFLLNHLKLMPLSLVIKWVLL